VYDDPARCLAKLAGVELPEIDDIHDGRNPDPIRPLNSIPANVVPDMAEHNKTRPKQIRGKP
jgi:hypothetical protein